MSPVGSFGLRVCASRITTSRLTAMTYSPRSSFAFACAAGGNAEFTTTCVMPPGWRTPIKISWPKALIFAAQPMSVTCLPMSDARSSPQECVRSRFPRWSNIMKTSLCNPQISQIFLLCNLWMVLYRSVSRNTQRAPVAGAKMFGQKHDLTDVIRVVHELSIDRLHHRVRFAADTHFLL